ncbi:MAG: hypothetical protein OXI30_20285 [Chloroflexota bacterium]|nr:hypothetical protein [Chloroflexota bacterium]
MSAQLNEDRSAKARDKQKASSVTAYPRETLEDRPSSMVKPRSRRETKLDKRTRSEQEYISALRRSIKQMKDGDVQPVREGLAELRRELEANDEVNSLDT